MKFSIIFLAWLSIGMILMVFFVIPPWLQFSNAVFLVLYAVSTVEIAYQVFGRFKKLLLQAGTIALITYFIEWIGIKTGFPFGAYSYYPTLGALLFGVPFTIALAWVGVIINSTLLSSQQSKWKRSLETGMWVILLDLILDPVAAVRDFWSWHDGGGFFGVPLANFISWGIIAGFCSCLLPVKPVSEKQYVWAVRIFQAMLLMFGMLALKEKMYPIFLLAVIFIFFAEGRYRFDYRRKKQMV